MKDLVKKKLTVSYAYDWRAGMNPMRMIGVLV